MSTVLTARIGERPQGPITSIDEWPLPPSSAPALFPVGHPSHTPYQQTQWGSPSKCGRQPKCEGEPNTDPSPNASTPTTSTSVKQATTQAPAIHYQHGELRIQHQGEGMQLG
ncbi:hypothetical protein K443DRAFT_14377 [Laccaria amethystina LaAM-08-1]|uniref:Uncharacterized protein n=1 Tax=Laccaria amethystina LaAM-08-1 TaxID=1095629 RepID=A0A0C9X1I3_9AGAR|nr:hypothetical protein K443DRAFT_14377 [Laccaria amethystina LaAM-08-1]